MDDRLKKIFDDYDRGKEEVRKHLPKELQIEKQKLMCGLGKTEYNITKAEKKIVKDFPVRESFAFLSVKPYRSLHWTDTLANNKVRDIIEKHQYFDISVYLQCAKAVCVSFTGNVSYFKAFTYVLTHARLFGDTAQNMFQLNACAGAGCAFEMEKVTTQLPDTEYMSKISDLIENLTATYDESTYRILNVNITYLTLLSLRRYIRNEKQFGEALRSYHTHGDYVKLCPHPLGAELPKVSEHFNKFFCKFRIVPSVYLAIHGHLTATDARTKRVLRMTFIQHAEWTGLQLPSLFFRVVRLYEMEETKLWDYLSNVTTYKSLFKLADAYYKQYEGRQCVPPESSLWFPFCRVLNGDYHRDLSASENKFVCYTLAYLVDLKIGFDKSFVRNSHWTQKCEILNGTALKLAKAIVEIHNEGFDT